MASSSSSDINTAIYPLSGGCACGKIRYRMETAPLFVHCCHCTWCQRETGTAFALNALIESDRVTITSPSGAAAKETTDAFQITKVPSASGGGQTFTRCAECLIAVWSVYGTDGDSMYWVRVGTLDRAECVPPSIHIYTSTKLPWVVLPDEKSGGVPVREETYRMKECWPVESQERMKVLNLKIKAERSEEEKGLGKM